MMRRELGTTGFRISVIGFGTFAVGGWMWGEQDDADSLAAIRAALDAGVNWIDTAPIYGSGRADRLVGRALAELPRDRRPLVFTKFGHRLVDGQRVNCASRAQVVADCDSGLRDLGVEAIDLFQLHWPAPEPIAESAAACADLLRAGKIRAIGACNLSVAQLEEWRATGVPLHCLQTPYSIIRRQAADTVLPWCDEHGVGAIAYSTLHRGLLFGNWGADKTFSADDHRSERPDYRGRRFQRFLQAVEELRVIAAEDDATVAQLAIGVLVCTQGLTGCIVGARDAQQGAALGDLGMPATAKQVARVDEVIARLEADLAAIGEC
jgi:aryl-alcohol dehydrogenase-like predicted oxidoreductase